MQLSETTQWIDASKARRSTRIETDVLIEVQGDGFAYAGETVRVSLHGALIRTSAPLQVGTPVTVYVHRTGKSAQAQIVSVVHDTSSRYGIELKHPGNIWGVAAAPSDWRVC
jgi:PilZ domain